MKKILLIFFVFISSLCSSQIPIRTFEDPHGWDKHAAAGFISGVVAGGIVFWKTHNSRLTLIYTIGVPVILGGLKEGSDKFLHTGVASWDDFAYTVYGGAAAVVGLGGYLSIHNQTKQERELKRIQQLEMNSDTIIKYNPDMLYQPIH